MKIRKLEWEKNGAYWNAETPFGQYRIEGFNELDEAKRFCQKDFEERVKACIERKNEKS